MILGSEPGRVSKEKKMLWSSDHMFKCATNTQELDASIFFLKILEQRTELKYITYEKPIDYQISSHCTQ